MSYEDGGGFQGCARGSCAAHACRQAGRRASGQLSLQPACLACADSTVLVSVFDMCVAHCVLCVSLLPVVLCRAWGGALAAAHAWEGPGRSPTRMQASRHPSSSRRTASAAYRAAAGGFQSGEDDDEDDSWADRLWQDMQEHKRAAAAASKQRAGVSSPAGLFSAGSSRAEAARERERKTAAAAAESARILKEEQAKDAHWRAAMMRQVQEVRTLAASTCVCCWQLRYPCVVLPRAMSTAAAGRSARDSTAALREHPGEHCSPNHCCPASCRQPCPCAAAPMRNAGSSWKPGQQASPSRSRTCPGPVRHPAPRQLLRGSSHSSRCFSWTPSTCRRSCWQVCLGCFRASCTLVCYTQCISSPWGVALLAASRWRGTGVAEG
jgi:hypothetical protein